MVRWPELGMDCQPGHHTHAAAAAEHELGLSCTYHHAKRLRVYGTAGMLELVNNQQEACLIAKEAVGAGGTSLTAAADIQVPCLLQVRSQSYASSLPGLQSMCPCSFDTMLAHETPAVSISYICRTSLWLSKLHCMCMPRQCSIEMILELFAVCRQSCLQEQIGLDFFQLNSMLEAAFRLQVTLLHHSTSLPACMSRSHSTKLSAGCTHTYSCPATCDLACWVLSIRGYNQPSILLHRM